jgi:L-ribulokinase
MALVAGVDFGTLSVRVSIVDSDRGLPATSLLHHKPEDPEYAAQSQEDQMRALASAAREAVRKAGMGGGDQVKALAADTTGSSVMAVGKNLEPLEVPRYLLFSRPGRSSPRKRRRIRFVPSMVAETWELSLWGDSHSTRVRRGG